MFCAEILNVPSLTDCIMQGNVYDRSCEHYREIQELAGFYF